MRFQFTAIITPDEARQLDSILQAAGFANRTDYLTALLHTTIYGSDADTKPLPERMFSWIDTVRDRAADHDRLLAAAFAVFDEIAFATIAMKGTGSVLAHIGSDLEAAIFERCGIVPAVEDLRTYLRVYQNIRRPQLMQYRTAQVAEEYRSLCPAEMTKSSETPGTAETGIENPIKESGKSPTRAG